MKTTHKVTFAALLLAGLGLASSALAQDTSVPYDRVRGELSIGTSAPNRSALMSVLTDTNAAPNTIFAMLEYGERVECFECMPLVESKLISADDARVREISAWWLRRRAFGFGAVMHHMKDVLANDPNAVHRARAAAAIGEFMDINGVAPLATAMTGDTDAAVRTAAVHGLARINAPTGNAMLSIAFGDTDVGVRREALASVSRVNFFRAFDQVLPLLNDTDVQVKASAARILGTYARTEAVPALVALLQSDADAGVRQAAAWALGRIGGTDAATALAAASSGETNQRVRDAVNIARAMH